MDSTILGRLNVRITRWSGLGRSDLRVLHLVRRQGGPIFAEMVRAQLTEEQVLVVFLEPDPQGRSSLPPCVIAYGLATDEVSESEEGESLVLGYSELLEVILEATNIFVW